MSVIRDQFYGAYIYCSTLEQPQSVEILAKTCRNDVQTNTLHLPLVLLNYFLAAGLYQGKMRIASSEVLEITIPPVACRANRSETNTVIS